MGPFSNNQIQLPTAPSNGSTLPIPDVEGAPHDVFVSPDPEHEGVKKWLLVTLIIVGVMAVSGIIVFALYVYVSNTPNYMLNAAFRNLIASDGQAGTIVYQSKRGSSTGIINGNFLGYTDPSNSHVSTLTVSIGQDASRVSATTQLFADGNYAQTAGLGNLARLVGSIGGDTSALTPDNLVRLSSLNGQWYTLSSDDIQQVSDIFRQHTLQSGPNATDIEKLEQLYLQHPFVSAAQQFNDERIDNINSMHIKITLDLVKLNSFLQSVKATNIKSLQLTNADIQSILKSPAISGTTLEVWIARSDHSFEQIRATQGTHVLTITFGSEEAAAQRQTVLRPNDAQSAAGFIRQLHDVLATTPPANVK